MDDVALTTEGAKDMEHQLNTMNGESLNIGLQVHKRKIKFMTIIESTDKVQIDRAEIEKVTNYKY